MVYLRTYMVLFDSIPIEKSKIRAGTNPANLVAACRCVNTSLFVSRDLRRDVEISLGRSEDNLVSLITFPGDELKRVSPDERSISFFIMKAAQHLDEMDLGQEKIMDNGIRLEKGTMANMLDSFSKRPMYLADQASDTLPDQISLNPQGVFVYIVGGFSKTLSQKVSFERLHKTKHPERFINDLNRAFDYS